MQKLVYKFIAFIVIFLCMGIYFIINMEETAFQNEIEVTKMSKAGFPTVMMVRDGIKINLLHGYSTEDDGFFARDEITPLSENDSVEFLVNPYENKIIKAEYELKDRIDNIVVSQGEVKDRLGGEVCKIKFDTELTANREYALKLRLVNENSRKFIFYTSLKFVRGDSFLENYNFSKKFLDATLEKNNPEAIKPYLETDKSMDNSSFSYVNIHSSYSVITWGELQFKMVTPPVVKVTENIGTVTALLYNYMGMIEGNDTSIYKVSEYYKLNKIEDVNYLLAYERKVEELYNPKNISLSKSQFKLGITRNTNSSILVEDNKKYLSFIREGELWDYDVDENKLVRVFSFLSNNNNIRENYDEREYYSEHRIKNIKFNENGDLYFIVYGYMNLGVYEGRVGIILYKYIRKEDRIEELAYIPVIKKPDLFYEEIERLSYISMDDKFYFTVGGRMYSYNLVKKRLEVLSDEISENSYLYIPERNILVWQNNLEPRKSKSLLVLNLETGEKTAIETENNEIIVLLGKIEDNFVYGIADDKDVRVEASGDKKIYYKEIVISDVDRNILKRYKRDKIYVVGVSIENQTITLERAKEKDGEITKIKDDQILNDAGEDRSEVAVTDRRTKKHLTEYYLSLPYGLKLNEEPEVLAEVSTTVITSDRTIKLIDYKKANNYYANIAGEIVSSSDRASNMIELAKNKSGFVIDEEGMLIWERDSTNIVGKSDYVDIDYMYKEDDSIHSAIRLFLTAKGIYISTEELNRSNLGIMDILEEISEVKPIDLTGTKLEEVCYYINQGSPIIAMKTKKEAVLITSYTTKNIEILNVRTAKTEHIDKNSAKKLFEEAGNIFISTIN